MSTVGRAAAEAAQVHGLPVEMPNQFKGRSTPRGRVSALPTTARAPLPRAKIIHPSELMARNRRTLAAMLDALTEIGARHALIGGLVAGYYGKGRATVDVDLLVPKRSMKCLQAALERCDYELRAFPDMNADVCARRARFRGRSLCAGGESRAATVRERDNVPDGARDRCASAPMRRARMRHPRLRPAP